MSDTILNKTPQLKGPTIGRASLGLSYCPSCQTHPAFLPNNEESRYTNPEKMNIWNDYQIHTISTKSSYSCYAASYKDLNGPPFILTPS